MILLFTLLLVGHVFFDFYFQTENMVKNKSFSINGLKAIFHHLIHAVSHGVISFSLCFLFSFYFLDCTTAGYIELSTYFLLYITFFHFFIDATKECLSLFLKGFYSFVVFVIDQALHVSILFFGMMYFFKEYNNYIYQVELIKFLSAPMIVFCAALILLKPSSIVVSLFLKSSGINDGSESVKITKSQISQVIYSIFSKKFSSDSIQDYDAEVQSYKDKANKIISSISDGKADIDVVNVSKINNAGRVVGYVERIIMLLFFIFGSVTAVVAVLAMKTALRFSDLKDDNDSGKAEYIMVGTFFSLLITVVIAFIARKYLVDLGAISASLN